MEATNNRWSLTTHVDITAVGKDWHRQRVEANVYRQGEHNGSNSRHTASRSCFLKNIEGIVPFLFGHQAFETKDF